MEIKRYFVDERSGIIAVCDRVYIDPDYSGLHSDTPGVVMSRFGIRQEEGYWTLSTTDIQDMNKYCQKLNEGEVVLGDWRMNIGKMYICECGGSIA